MQHPLIVIEGGDAAGKKTQTELLLQALEERGFHCSAFSFPRYNHFYGSLIRRSLNGEFGDFLSLNPYLASPLYTLDRVEAKKELRKALKQGPVICDRYTPSNLAFQGAKLSGIDKDEFIMVTEQAEYGNLKLPRPSIVIYLKVPVEVSAQLSQSRSNPDQHEADLDYQRRVVEVYQEMVLNAPLVNVGGTLYLNTASMSQLVGLYGGTATASVDGNALSMTIGDSTVVAVAGQSWIIRINGGVIYPVWLGSYSGTPYVSGQASYWPVGDLYWLLLKNGQIQVNATGSGVTLYVTPTSKG